MVRGGGGWWGVEGGGGGWGGGEGGYRAWGVAFIS